MLSHQQIHLRYAAIRAIAKIGNPAAKPHFLAAIRELLADPDEAVRDMAELAAETLGRDEARKLRSELLLRQGEQEEAFGGGRGPERRESLPGAPSLGAERRAWAPLTSSP